MELAGGSVVGREAWTYQSISSDRTCGKLVFVSQMPQVTPQSTGLIKFTWAGGREVAGMVGSEEEAGCMGIHSIHQ